MCKKIYIKNNQEVTISPKFVYCISIYKIGKNSASLLEEKRCASIKPINTSVFPSSINKKGFSVYRFIDLESAPEDYLITNGYKLK